MIRLERSDNAKNHFSFSAKKGSVLSVRKDAVQGLMFYELETTNI